MTLLGRLCAPVAAVVLVTACSDALERTSSAGQVIAFSNLTTVSLISAVGFDVTTVALGSGYSGVSLAGRGSVLLVVRNGGAGGDSRVDVIDLARPGGSPDAFTLAGRLLGGAVQDDSIAWLAVGDQGAVARVNYRTHVATRLPVGGVPRAVAITRARVFVVNSNDGGAGAASWVSAVDPVGTSVVDSIPLTGGGAVAVVVGADSLLYVTETGPGGRISVVDPVAMRELVVINGLGGDIDTPVFHPSGRLLIPAGVDGMLEVNTLTRSVVRGPGNGLKPHGHGVIALALDNGGRVYAGDPDCSVVHVLAGPPDFAEIRLVNVTGCPGTAATAARP